MTIVQDFSYQRARDVADALALLKSHGPHARLLAGGTDLIGWLNEGQAQATALIDIKGIKALKAVVLKGKTLTIGALATFTDILESGAVVTKFPLIAEAAHKVASVGIRNRATLVGNICSAVPCCDAGPVLIAYGASVVLQAAGGKRRKVPVEHFFKAPRKTVVAAGEMVVAVEVPDAGKHGACYVKLGRYRGEDLAQASVAVVALPGQTYRVAFGSVGPTPLRGVKTEAVLRGRTLDQAVVAEACGVAQTEIAPISDIRASKEYRRHMVGVMLARGLDAAVARMNGDGPALHAELL